MVSIASNDGLYYNILQIVKTLQRITLSPRLKHEKKITHFR